MAIPESNDRGIGHSVQPLGYIIVQVDLTDQSLFDLSPKFVELAKEIKIQIEALFRSIWIVAQAAISCSCFLEIFPVIISPTNEKEPEYSP
ncbi:MAG: hypothetical protein P4L49_12785 [Desulfosporosinus sp.]|nr:hypothetical protein [Desulfosporosinus sp.]